MKEKIFSIIIMLLTLSFVIINTIVLEKKIENIYDDVNAIDINDENHSECEEKAKQIYKRFRKEEKYISLTVNHDDLTNIEVSFSELIGYLSVGDSDGAEVTKNRLLDSLEHLGRLSGFNIDAII